LTTLRGTYLVSYVGFIATQTETTYGTLLGVISIDPSKTPSISGGVTFTGFGPARLVPTVGTVEVSADCTGTIKLGNPDSGAGEVDQFFYDRDSKTLHVTAVRVMLGNIASLGTWKQISPMPGMVTWPAPPK
jgi:hypothetical protein